MFHRCSDAADFTADLLRDTNAFRDFAKAQPTGARKLLQALRDFIRKVKEKFSRKAARDLATMEAYGVRLDELEQAAKRWKQALWSAEVTAKKLGTMEQEASSSDGTEIRFSISRMLNKTWDEQIRSHKHSDTLVVQQATDDFLVSDNVKDLPLAIPLSVITKATSGRDETHSISDKNIRRLHNGIKNAPIVINNPTRNALIYITGMKDRGGNITVIFAKEQTFDGDFVHKATTIHTRVDPIAMLQNLKSDATVFVRKNILDQVPGSSLLKSGTLKTKIKYIDDSITQSGKNVNNEDSRFSLSLPIERTRDLVAVHNLTEENLQKALELGGLAMPSIAITNAKDGHRAFGEISLVFPSSSIDPQTDSRNRIYSDDAWTPIVPTVRDGKVLDRNFQQVEATLENIVRIMQEAPESNARDFKSGVEGAKAGMIRKYDSIREVQQDRGRVRRMSEEKYMERYFALARQLTALVDEVGDADVFGAAKLDEVEAAIIRAASTMTEDGSVDAVRDSMQESGFPVTQEDAEKISSFLYDVAALPVRYFEAKPQRAVDFSEVRLAVVPDGTDAALLQRLKDAGVEQVQTYRAGDDKARIRAVNSVKALRFSLKGINEDGIEVYESSDFVKNMSKKQRIKAYKSMMAEEFAGRVARFSRNGHTYYAKINRRLLDKGLYGDDNNSPNGARALSRIAAEGDVFDLVENAAYDGSKTDTKSHKDTDYFDYFIKTVQIDGTLYDLIANVEKQYYETDGYTYSISLRDKKTVEAPRTVEPSDDDVHSVVRKASTDTHYTRDTEDVKRYQLDNDQIADRYTEAMRENERLGRQIEDLQAKIAYLKAQTKRTTIPKVRPEDARKLARSLKARWGSDVDTQQLASGLEELTNYIMRGGEELYFERARGKAGYILFDVLCISVYNFLKKHQIDS